MQAAADLGDLALGLHPRALAEGGLCAALEVLVQGTPCRVLLKVDVQGIPADLEPTIYYLCAEALANVTKHAGATEARVEVSSRGDLVLVEVTDDGAGGADPSSGTGLQGLADRVQAVGGTLQVNARPGPGGPGPPARPLVAPGGRHRVRGRLGGAGAGDLDPDDVSRGLARGGWCRSGGRPGADRCRDDRCLGSGVLGRGTGRGGARGGVVRPRVGGVAGRPGDSA